MKKVEIKNIAINNLLIILMLLVCPGLVGTMQAAYWLCWGYTNVNNTRTNGVAVTAVSRVNPNVVVNTTSYQHPTYGNGYFLASYNGELPQGEYDVHFSYEPHLRNKVINYQSSTVNMGDVYLVRAELWSDDTIVILRNSQIEAIFCKYTGIMRGLTVKGHGGLLSYDEPGQIIFKDAQSSEYSQYANGNVTQIDSTMTDPKWVKAVFHLDFPYHSALITITADTLTLRWDNDFWLKSGTDRAARLDFSLPLLDAWHYAFWASDSGLRRLTSTFDEMFIYRQNVALPVGIVYDTSLNYGLSLVCPFDVKKPALSYRFNNDQLFKNLTISYDYLRMGNNSSRHAYSSLYLVPHAGDWRLGLAWLHDKYPAYFDPNPSSPASNGEGWYCMGGPFSTTAFMDTAQKYNVKWQEFHSHFPFYGLYAPTDRDTWMLLSDQNTYDYEDWLGSPIPGIPTNTYLNTRNKISQWTNRDIQSYMYFQSFEAWKSYIDYPSTQYSSYIAKRSDGVTPIEAWQYCYLMNPDTNLYPGVQHSWAAHIDSQIACVLDSYPSAYGIFYDRDDYCNYDYAHDDSVTMINNSHVYMLGFAQEEINKHMCEEVHNRNKGIWTNGPTSIEVCKGMDGIMAEACGQAPWIKYLGLTRPLILLIYDADEYSTETKHKIALAGGYYPSIAAWGATIASRILDRKYQPLYAFYKSKKWVLEPQALRLPLETTGNIFQAQNGDYLIPMVSMNAFQVYMDPYVYGLLIRAAVAGLGTRDHCYLLSGNYLGPRWLSFTPGSSVTITVPEHLASSLIQLSEDPRYEYSAISSPVLRRGTDQTFQLRVQNIGDNDSKSYYLILDTPFGDDTYQFNLGAQAVYNLEYSYSIPDDQPLAEDTFYVIETNANPDDTTLFTAWIVDDVSLQLPQKLFIKFPAVDTFPLTIVNNEETSLNVTLSGTFTTGHGTITFIGYNPVSLEAHERKDLKIQVALEDLSGTLQIVGEVNGNEIVGSIVRPVERAMRPTLGDLFFDDFNRGYMNFQWTKWDPVGAWSVEDNMAKGNGDYGCHFATVAAGDQNWTNYRVQMNTKMCGSTLASINWLKSYMFVRVQDATKFYRFGFHGDGGIIDLYRRDGAEPEDWIFLGKYEFRPKKNVWYNLSVEVIGDSIKCYLNGTRVISVKDGTYAYGGIGIGVLEDNMTVYYDDIVIRPFTLPLTLFQDNFNGGSEDTLWNKRQGTWIVMDSALQKFWRGYGSAHFATVMEGCDWSDYRFQVKTRMRGSTNPLISWIKSYIFFRIQDDQNYYRFGFHGDGGCIDLYKRVNGNWIYLASYNYNARRNTWYTLKIEITGNQIKGFLGSSNILTYTDNNNPFQNGGIGIGVLEDYMKNDYDDVKVESFTEPPPP